MLKNFNIHEWFVLVKHCLLFFIPHLSIYLIFFFYILIGANIFHEIESNRIENSSLIKTLQEERERLIIKIIEKREIYNLQQYTKFVYKHLRQYEEEIKKQYLIFQENSSWNFSRSLIFLTTSLTTIDSNEFIPKNFLGKLFLIIYIGFGIPLTLIFLTNLSSLIKKFIQYILFIFSSKHFLYIRQFFNRKEEEEEEEEEEDDNDDDDDRENSFNNHNHLHIKQIIFILFIYILLGNYFLSSKTFVDNFYICFTMLFTINFNKKFSYENQNLLLMIIYLYCGLAIVLLYIKTSKKIIELFLINMGKKLLRNLLDWTQQIGFHDLNPDYFLSNTDWNFSPTSDLNFFRQRNIIRTKSLDQSSTLRPVSIAEPLRRLSTSFIRAFKTNDNDENKKFDKNIQVSTIIRRCGRCAETSLPIQPLRKHNVITPRSSSISDNNSSCEDDDIMDFPPPNLARIRQRRATLVAKTIISQLATQPRSSSIDELIPPLTFSTEHRRRSRDTSPVVMRSSQLPSSSDSSPKRGGSQEEFVEISKQISALLTPSDDEDEHI